MIADAVHSLSDFATDVVVLLFVRLAGKPRDRDHAYGHGKYETLGTAIIGLTLLGIGLMIRGAQSTADNIRYTGKKLQLSRGLILGAVTLAFGAVLVILPLASSRLFFHIVGIVLISLGVAQGWDKLRGRNLLEEGSDPNIIDVEKL
jgi:divalent metal cation (Fe/Co/Zn/Cd) transporter